MGTGNGPLFLFFGANENASCQLDRGEWMSVYRALLAYLMASTLLTITPGLDTAFVLRTVTVAGRGSAIGASAGICLGLLAWGCVASLGIAKLLNASRVGYHVLQIAGGIYLIALGLKILHKLASSWGRQRESEAERTAEFRDQNLRRWLTRGMLTNLLNPKVGVFYMTFLPSFVPVGVDVAKFSLLLVSIHIVEGMIWFGLLIAASLSLTERLRDPRCPRMLDALTGAVLLGFGVKALFQQRP